MENSHSSVTQDSHRPNQAIRSQGQTRQISPRQSSLPGAEVDYIPAAPTKRLYATVIDFFTVSIPFGLAWELAFNKITPPLILHDAIFWVLFALLTTFCTARFGATIGKKIMKIRTVQHHNSPLTIYQFFLREFLVGYCCISLYTLIFILMISGLDPEYIGGFNLLYFPGFLVGLGFLLIFKKPYMPLHDRIFKTGVVSTDPNILTQSKNR